MVHRVLVAIDGSTASKTALEIACALADKYEAALGLLSVIEPEAISDEVVKAAQVEGIIPPDKTYSGVYDSYWVGSFDNYVGRAENTARLASQIADELVETAEAFAADKPFKAVKTFVKGGDPAKEIVKCAKENAADVIVMGHDPQGRVESIFKSSVAEKVQRNAHCAVLIYCAPNE